MDTNAKLLTVDDIFRMEGRQKGWSPSDAELKSAQATVNDLNRSRLDPPRFISLTNTDDGAVVRGIQEGGKFREIPLDKIRTPQGTFVMNTATNAVPVYLPDGSIAKNYMDDPTMGDMPQPAPLAGGGMTATNAPTAAPVQTPAPSPTPAGASSLEGKKVVQNGVTYLISNNIPHVQINGQWVPQR